MTKFSKIAICLAIGCQAIFAYDSTTASLRKISDGDTMIFHNSSGEIKCRIYGIDTPEKFKTAKFKRDMVATGLSEAELKRAGEASTNYAKQRLHINDKYELNLYGIDKYGRNLCVILLPNGESFNEKIVKDGYAVVYKQGKYTKDKELRHILNQAQGYAVKNDKGLWRNYSTLMKGMANN